MVPIVFIRSVVKVAKRNPNRVGRKERRELHRLCSILFFGFGVFCSGRPFYVKLGTFEQCLCLYHLRYDYIVMGVKNKLHALVDAGVITKTEVEDEDDAFETQLQLLSDAGAFI